MGKTNLERRRAWLAVPANRDKDRRKARERYRSKAKRCQTSLPL